MKPPIRFGELGSAELVRQLEVIRRTYAASPDEPEELDELDGDSAKRATSTGRASRETGKL